MKIHNLLMTIIDVLAQASSRDDELRACAVSHLKVLNPDLDSTIVRRSAALLILDGSSASIEQQREMFQRLDDTPESIAWILKTVTWIRDGSEVGLTGKKKMKPGTIFTVFNLFIHGFTAHSIEACPCPVALALVQKAIDNSVEAGNATPAPAKSRCDLN